MAPEVEVEQPQQRRRQRELERLPVLRLALGDDQPRRPASLPRRPGARTRCRSGRRPCRSRIRTGTDSSVCSRRRETRPAAATDRPRPGPRDGIRSRDPPGRPPWRIRHSDANQPRPPTRSRSWKGPAPSPPADVRTRKDPLCRRSPPSPPASRSPGPVKCGSRLWHAEKGMVPRWPATLVRVSSPAANGPVRVEGLYTTGRPEPSSRAASARFPALLQPLHVASTTGRLGLELAAAQFGIW